MEPRRIKHWLKHAVEPALKQVGNVIKEYSQAVYTAHKVFRIVQPNAIEEEKNVEINVPLYNDFGNAIGKWRDYASAKFDVRVIAGSTLPINRWAYLSELKELMNLGVVDDVAVLAETDIKNKESIVKRKSLYAQLKGQIANLEEQLKKEKGTNETLERQIIQSNIKNKVMQADVEVNKQKESTKAQILKEELESKAKQKHMRQKMEDSGKNMDKELSESIYGLQKSE